MDEVIDRTLRSDAELWRDLQPEVPTVTIPAERSRRVKPAFAIASCAAAVAATLLVTSLISSDKPGPSAAVQTVPWTAPQDGTQHHRHPAAPAGTPDCKSKDLQPSTPVISAQSSATVLVNLTYTGASTCSVSVYGPYAQLKNAAGDVVGWTGGGKLDGLAPDKIAVNSGEVVTSGVTLYRSCASSTSPVPTTLTLGLSGNSPDQADRVQVTLPPITLPPCDGGALAGPEFILMPLNPSVAPAGDSTSLLPTIKAPTTVVTGQPLIYTVTLHNTTTTAIPLNPCPSYIQQLAPNHSDRPNLDIVALLNCDQAPATVPAGGSVAFEIHLDTEQNQPGPAILIWSIANITHGPGNAPHAQQSIVID